ncbi:MAG: recombination mediator RecR [Spirochaetales bacterium]|nr:recombination mediator RecR [Spirochaetales bacterium]
MNPLDSLVKTLSKLPGIGNKSARRVAHYLLKADSGWVSDLAEQIGSLQQKIRKCEICGNYTESSPCSICTDTTRDTSRICIVEQPEDINTIEMTGDFNGLYHVLGGVISPIDGMGPEQLSIGLLLKRLKTTNVEELIVATNPTIEGETTALYIVNLLKESNLTITQLASGLPAGGDLEYADRLTISRSLKGRRTLLEPKKEESVIKSIGQVNEKPLF